MRIVDSLSRRSPRATLIIGLVLATGSLLAAREAQPTTTKPTCADDNGGITLPAGFCATVFADNIGHVADDVAHAEVVVLQQDRSARAHRDRVLVACGGNAGVGRGNRRPLCLRIVVVAHLMPPLAVGLDTDGVRGAVGPLPRESVRSLPRSHRDLEGSA